MKLFLNNTSEYGLIDRKDYELIKHLTWNITKGFGPYIVAGGGNNKILLHRFLMNVTNTRIHVDHINGNGLDNRRNNLRLCTNQENHFNTKKRQGTTSKYKGVYWNTERKKWQVSVKDLNGKTKSLGRYVDEVEAAKAYDKYVKNLYGKFANPNFKES